MILGAIDIGTNSVRLLVAEKNDGWHDLLRMVEVTRLGEDVNRTKVIKPEAMNRTLDVLTKYKDLMDRHGVEKSKVISTSAMRDAKNSSEFISLTKERLGLKIEVISGEEEGRLTFSGATGQDSLVSKGALALVVDVGGGSTEYIYGRDQEVYGATSLDIGSVRLSELFLKHDPPLEEELVEVRKMIRKVADPVFSEIAAQNPSVMIAVAGTATQLSAVEYGVEPYDPEKIHGSKITLPQLKALIARLSSLPLEERKKVKGMHPQRADVIIPGALILEETLEALGLPEMVVGERDILDGVIYSLDR